MKPKTLFVAVVIGLAAPTVALAQENVTCAEYLAMDAQAQLAAIETISAKLLETGQNSRFVEGASDEEKRAVAQAQCTHEDSLAMPDIDLIDMLGQ